MLTSEISCEQVKMGRRADLSFSRLTRSGRRTTVGLVTLIPLSLTRKASPAARK